jgi:N-acetylneuraminate synthase
VTSPSFHIAGRRIGAEHPPYVIAEISANHNGSIEKARAIMTMARNRGADAVKLQTYTADTMTIESDRPDFCIEEGPWAGEMLYALYKRAETPFKWHADLFEHGRELGITVFSTPFDETAVELLEGLEAPAYKIASFEVVDLTLIGRVARTGKPMIMSTGMADLQEIQDAVACARDNGCRELALLHCVSGYPTPIKEANLRTLPDLSQRFGTVVGLSDHTAGVAAAVASVALGASLIEKHVTLARADGGPDAAFSLEPDELERLCRDSTDAWQALGRIDYERKDSEKPNQIFRRSIYAIRDIPAGGEIAAEDVRVIRPGYGLAPKYLRQLIGRSARQDIARGTAISWELLE